MDGNKEEENTPQIARWSLLDFVRRHCSRITSSGRYIPVIDGLRFIAIYSVVQMHILQYVIGRRFAGPHESVAAYYDHVVGNWLTWAMDHGRFGVQLFFAISGFILAIPFASHHLKAGPETRLSRYYWRRVTRIEPPFLINICLIFLVKHLLIDGNAGDLLPHFLASATYTHSLIYGTWSPVNSVIWSLEIEVQFYLLAPLLAQVFRIQGRYRRRMVLLATMALTTFAAWRFQEIARYQLSLLGQLPYFAVGFLLADLYLVDGIGRKEDTTWRWDIAGLIGWVAMVLALVEGGPWSLTLPLLVLLAYIGAFRGRVLHGVLSLGAVTLVGGMCYTIYLYHMAVLSFASKATARLYVDALPEYANVLLQTAILFPLVIFVSGFLFALFERPFMQVRGWRTRD